MDSSVVCTQPEDNDLLLVEEEEKFLFWKMAKKLCSERRRAQRDAAMKAYHQSLEPTIIPKDIVLPSEDNSTASDDEKKETCTVDLGNLFLSNTPTKSTKDNVYESRSSSSPYSAFSCMDMDDAFDDNDDDNSQVSDISRELPDIDAPTLYPSLDELDRDFLDIDDDDHQRSPGTLEVVGPVDDTEKPDWRTKEENTTAKDPELDDFAEAMKVLSMCKPSKGRLDLDDSSHYSSKRKEDLLSQNMANLTRSAEMKHMNLQTPIRRGKSTSSSLTPSLHSLRSSEHIIKEGVPRENLVRPTAFSRHSSLPSPNRNRTSFETSPAIPQRRGSDSSIASDKQSFDKRASEHMPAPPQRKLSLDSQTSNGRDTRFESERQWSTRRALKMPEWKRTKSYDSPVPPRRRRSNESRTSSTDDLTPTRAELGYEETDRSQLPRQTEHSKGIESFASCTYDSSDVPGAIKKSSSPSLPLPQRRATQPSREELGYNTDEGDRHQELPKYATWHNSFCSYDEDDNSTIATWTLGLYKRRKSLDSTVAPPITPAWAAPDTTPSRPKRRFSAGSVVREEPGATSESRWGCLSSKPKGKTENDGSAQVSIPPRPLSDRGTKNHQTATRLPSNSDQTKEVEIQPGLFLPLRGTQETAEAMQRNFVERTSCMTCAIKLLCIADAEYVLCPHCSTVSPVLANLGSTNGGCVGVGFESDEVSVVSSIMSTPMVSSCRIRS